MWLVCAILTALGWGIADIFYKRAAVEKEKFSHLKVCIFVGIVMGIHAIITLLVTKVDYNFINIIYYFPVSFCYFFSMFLVFYGLKYIEDSICSPIENSSGSVTAIFVFLFLGQRMSFIAFIAVLLITIGVLSLGLFEKHSHSKNKKYRLIGIGMAICYSIFNAIGGFLDAYYLDYTKSPLVGINSKNIEIVANSSYEFTFLIIAILFMIFLYFKRERKVERKRDKVLASIFETFGQQMYVFGMSGNAIIAAPIVSSVCIVSVILARIFLHERLTLKQYIPILLVISGIMILAFVEGA